MIEVGAVLAGFGLLGIGQSITRFFPYFVNEKGEVNGFLFLALSVPILGTIIITIVYLTNQAGILSFFDADKGFIESIYFPVLLIAIFRIYQTVLENISANYQRVAANNFIREVVNRMFLLGLAFLYYHDYYTFSDFCFYVAYVFGLNAILNFIILYSNVKLDFRPNWKFLKSKPDLKSDMLKYNLWLFGSSLAVLVVNKVDFLMISSEKGLEDTAIYSVAFYIAMLIEIPKRGVLQIASPIISKLMKAGNKLELDTLYKKASIAIFSVCTVLFFFIGFNLPLIMDFIPKGEIYIQGMMVVWIIGLGKTIEVLGLLAYPVLSNSTYYTYGFISSVINILIAISLNYLLIPIYGIEGAALATFSTFVISMIIQITVVWIKVKIQPFTTEHIKATSVLILGLILIVWFQKQELGRWNLIWGNALYIIGLVIWFLNSKYKKELLNYLPSYISRLGN